jgi:TRAP-type mannitol/chloroaromatic compound transport system substrate-binding protein
MERREFLRLGLPVATALAGLACARRQSAPAAPASSTVTVRWRLATSWPPNLPVFDHAPHRLAELLSAMSGGRFILEVDPATKHKAPFGVFDLVRNGTYDMAHTAAYYWKGKDPAMALLTTVPFGMNVWEQYAWFYYGGGLELMEKAFRPHGLLSFPAGNTGVQMGGWFRKEIRSVADFKGLKIRIPGLGGEVLARLGAEPITLRQVSSTPRWRSASLTPSNGSAPASTCSWAFRRLPSTTTWGGTNPQPNSSTWSIAAASKSSRRTSEQCSWWR